MGNFKNELKNYQPIPRELIFDKNISDRARFLYCYMAAKPEDWDFYLEPMAKEIGYSVDTLRKYLNELRINGWIRKGQQEITEGNKFGANTYLLKATRIGNFPTRKKTDTEISRHGDFPTRENTDTNIKEIITENRYIKKRDSKATAKKEKPAKRILGDWGIAGKEKPANEEEVINYFIEKGLAAEVAAIEAAKFIDHYVAVDWYVGKHKLKDWKAAVRNWLRNLNTYNTINTNKNGNTNTKPTNADTNAAIRENISAIVTAGGKIEL